MFIDESLKIENILSPMPLKLKKIKNWKTKRPFERDKVEGNR